MEVRIKTPQFQLGYMSNPGLNVNRAFKKKVEKSSNDIWQGYNGYYQNLFRKENSCVLSLLAFDENIKIVIFKVLGSVLYCIIDNYLCVDYLCLHHAKIYLEHKGFETTTNLSH